MRQLRSHIQRLNAASGGSALTVTGVRDSAAAMVAAMAAEAADVPVLCVTPGESGAALLAQDIELFSGRPVHHYPGYEIPPYTPLSPDPATTAQRLAALYAIHTASRPYIVTASAEALMRKVMPAARLGRLAELVMRGEETDPDDLCRRLILAGYEQMSLVQNAGEFSRRGGILDIFAPGRDYPLRLDFFGDTVESIRLFDPITQRSVAEIDEAEIIPVSDILFPEAGGGEEERFNRRLADLAARLGWDDDAVEVINEKLAAGTRFPGIEFFLPLLHDKLDAPLAYLPDNTLIVMVDPLEIRRSWQMVEERVEANFQEAAAGQNIILPPEYLFTAGTALQEAIGRKKRLLLPFLEETAADDDDGGDRIALNCGTHTLIRQRLELQRRKLGLLGALAGYIEDWLANNETVHIACRSRRHMDQLGRMLANYHIEARPADPPIDLSTGGDGRVLLYPRPLAAGFDLLDSNVHIISDLELFGDKRLVRGRGAKAKPKAAPVNFEELKIGDIVVHEEHGIGVYEGIVNIKVPHGSADFLQISYKDADKLYVPIDRIKAVSKYSGLTDKPPKITRLGSKAWSTAKKKVREAVWKVAQDLLDLYARRKLAAGHAFSPPDSLYRELEESFPYEETPGQHKAINDVLSDLCSEQCMDRLVCGDVGFGKTEVAVRAAFKVVEDGFQAAVLVPTTVLAEQHALTFRERLEGLPVRVECLNRFRSPAEQRRIVKDTAAGKVDIVIGTHRLLSKDVTFRRLGLLVIDEEHRFGVAHKEKLKKLKVGIDVLTLTATPIPRTLQMSLLGVRDLSVIQSPPRNRRPVKTFIAKYDDLVIKEAIIREMQRGGQVYLVHNRVRTIHELAARVQKLTPEARIAVAHGQMPGKDLEDIMVRFVRKEVDVLICTTIIESGLDIPNANTIIINRADRMGLAAIYQLRGRVGRANDQAYAYLLVPSLDLLQKDAKQRLRALMEYNELGGGFKLALSDLQIRGWGNILGQSQSGNIAAVGYDLYLDLLQRTVEDLKRGRDKALAGDAAADFEPEVTVNVSAFIPETYIPDPDQRYIAYRRIASLADSGEIEDLRDELQDRYGPLPAEADNLLAVMGLKIALKPPAISSLEQSPAGFVFSFVNGSPRDPDKIIDFLRRNPKEARLTPDGRLVVKAEVRAPEAVFPTVKKILRAIG